MFHSRRCGRQSAIVSHFHSLKEPDPLRVPNNVGARLLFMLFFHPQLLYSAEKGRCEPYELMSGPGASIFTVMPWYKSEKQTDHIPKGEGRSFSSPYLLRYGRCQTSYFFLLQRKANQPWRLCLQARLRTKRAVECVGYGELHREIGFPSVVTWTPD